MFDNNIFDLLTSRFDNIVWLTYTFGILQMYTFGHIIYNQYNSKHNIYLIEYLIEQQSLKYKNVEQKLDAIIALLTGEELETSSTITTESTYTDNSNSDSSNSTKNSCHSDSELQNDDDDDNNNNDDNNNDDNNNDDNNDDDNDDDNNDDTEEYDNDSYSGIPKDPLNGKSYSLDDYNSTMSFFLWK